MAAPNQNQSLRKRKKREKVEVKVEVIPATKGLSSPFVGYFPTSFDPLRNNPNGSTSSTTDSEIKIRAFRNTEKYKPGRLQLVVSKETDCSGVDFVGTNYSGEGAVPQPCSYSLGVLDKEKGTLKIVPIAGNKIFRLEPRVRGVKYIDTEDNMNSQAITDENRWDKLKGLTQVFGTRQQQLQAKRRDERQPKQENLPALGELEKHMEEAEIQKNVIADSPAIRNIPPHDLSASEREKVYPIDKIILKVEWEHLRNFQMLLEDENDPEVEKFPVFVRNRIPKLQEIKNHEEKQKLAGILAYIVYLMRFKDTFGRKKGGMDEIPGVILAKFVKTFSDPTADKWSKENTELLVGYILVLTLFADGFVTELSDIAKDLSMTVSNVRMHFQALGCTVSTVNRKLHARLSVPLQFSALTQLPKQRGRRR